VAAELGLRAASPVRPYFTAAVVVVVSMDITALTILARLLAQEATAVVAVVRAPSQSLELTARRTEVAAAVAAQPETLQELHLEQQVDLVARVLSL
jgi:Trk K+ transport system NAD-binding subunit